MGLLKGPRHSKDINQQMKPRRVAEFSKCIRSVGGNTDRYDFHDAVTTGFGFIRTSHSVSPPHHHKGRKSIRVFDGDSCSLVMASP